MINRVRFELHDVEPHVQESFNALAASMERIMNYGSSVDPATLGDWVKKTQKSFDDWYEHLEQHGDVGCCPLTFLEKSAGGES